MSNSHNHTGDDLLRQIKNGDEDAFRDFCDKYRKILFIRAKRLLKNEDEAEDVVQEIFLWIWEHRDTIDVSQGIQAWLMGAVRNKTASLVRQQIARRRREKDYVDLRHQFVPESSSIETEELRVQIDIAINDISPAARQAFILSYLEDKTQKEIAAEMGIKVQSVKNHIHRAVTQLRKKLQENRQNDKYLFNSDPT